MVIEILSSSTRKKDMGLKLKKYITARVREYWMVDPDKKKVVVYDLEHNELPAIYGFEQINNSDSESAAYELPDPKPPHSLIQYLQYDCP